MPESVRAHWKFSIGRNANPDLVINFGEGPVPAEEVKVVLTEDEGGESVSVGVYHPLLREGESPAWWRAEVLVDNAVGELVNTEFVSVIKVLEEARRPKTASRSPNCVRCLPNATATIPDGRTSTSSCRAR